MVQLMKEPSSGLPDSVTVQVDGNTIQCDYQGTLGFSDRAAIDSSTSV